MEIGKNQSIICNFMKDAQFFCYFLGDIVENREIRRLQGEKSGETGVEFAEQVGSTADAPPHPAKSVKQRKPAANNIVILRPPAEESPPWGKWLPVLGDPSQSAG